MDTSETYIKMCDCVEIQEQRNDFAPKIHDFVSDIHQMESWIKDCGWTESSIWLPRQDQIQEMLGYIMPKKTPYMEDAVDVFKFKTWEQFWLAFYMHEKHKKVWSGEKWEKSAK